MIELNEATNNAYMLRNDGKYFTMIQHVYGNPDDIVETIAAAEWLYGATQHSRTKETCLTLVVSWGASIDYSKDPIENLLNEISIRPYRFLSVDFVKSHEKELRSIDIQDDLDSLNLLVVSELNQEFCRARYGGKYNSTVGSREMVFRISSVGFNWFNVIYQFVYDNKNKIDNVTVVKDEESTGFDGSYSHHGKTMYMMPVDEFLMLPGNPVIESLNESVNSLMINLKSGKSIQESLTNINRGILVNRYRKLLYNQYSTLSNM